MDEIGQLFVVGVEATAFDETLRGLIEDEQVGGLILFQRNVRQDLPPEEARATLRELLTAIVSCASQAGQPTPFLMIDHEGGRVHRLPGSATRFPPPGRLAGLPRDRVAAVCAQQADELRAIGFNTLLGPVLDVCPAEGTESHIAARAWSGDPEQAAALGALAIETFLEHGLLPVPKHFPGYGAAPIDPHLDLPTRTHSLESLAAYDMVPFQRAIELGCPALMTAHIVVPALDPERPCTLSPAWLTYLRETLGFKGCVVSDDLCMASVRERSTPAQLAEATVRAGLDVLLICHPEPGEIAATRGHLQALARTEPGFKATVAQALGRVAAAKARLAQPSAVLDPNLFAAGEQLRTELVAAGVAWPD